MLRILWLVVLSTMSISNVVAQDIPPCVPECTNSNRGKFAEFNCANADDAPCLCPKVDFSFGIRDCGKPCGANDDIVRNFLAGVFCQGQPLPSAQTSSLSSAILVTSSNSPPATTQASSTATSPPTSTSTASTTQHTSSETSSQTLSVSTWTSTDQYASSPAPAATSATSTDTSGAPASETPPVTDTHPSNSGLSKAATIGIGVGAGAAVIAIVSVGVCLFMKNRKQVPHHPVGGSKPLAGTGRSFAPRDHNRSFEKYSNDIEMTTNRYEDMVPRQQPRTMV